MLCRSIRGRAWDQMDERELRLAVSRYLTNVTYVDHCLGHVLTALQESDMAESTVVVYFRDHGELLGERGRGFTKYSLYDSAMHVPLLVRWPGLSRPGSVSDAPVELVDLLPTWLDAAGMDVPPYLPGRSLRPLLQGETPAAVGWRDATLSELYTPVDPPSAARAQWALRTPRYKLIELLSARSALYDLQSDPNEFGNRIDDPAFAAVREGLRRQLLQGVLQRAEQYPALDTARVVIARPATQQSPL